MKKYGGVDFNNPLINELKSSKKTFQVKSSLLKIRFMLWQSALQVGTVVNKELLNLENSTNDAFDNLESVLWAVPECINNMVLQVLN